MDNQKLPYQELIEKIRQVGLRRSDTFETMVDSEAGRLEALAQKLETDGKTLIKDLGEFVTISLTGGCSDDFAERYGSSEGLRDAYQKNFLPEAVGIILWGNTLHEISLVGDFYKRRIPDCNIITGHEVDESPFSLCKLTQPGQELTRLEELGYSFKDFADRTTQVYPRATPFLFDYLCKNVLEARGGFDSADNVASFWRKNSGLRRFFPSVKRELQETGINNLTEAEELLDESLRKKGVMDEALDRATHGYANHLGEVDAETMDRLVQDSFGKHYFTPLMAKAVYERLPTEKAANMKARLSNLIESRIAAVGGQSRETPWAPSLFFRYSTLPDIFTDRELTDYFKEIDKRFPLRDFGVSSLVPKGFRWFDPKESRIGKIWNSVEDGGRKT